VREHEILAGADSSSTGRGAADWAAQRASGRGLLLHLVRVVPEPSYYRVPAQYGEAVARAQALLAVERDRLAARYPALQILTSWRPGEPERVLSLLSVAAEIVVLGSDRTADRGGEGFGSVSFQAAVLCRSPVAVIPAPTAANPTGVVVGFDGSPDSDVALEMAGEEASRAGEGLTVLHATPKTMAPGIHRPDPQGLLSAAAGRIRDVFPGLPVREVLESDDSPADALVRAATQASLLVIGCWGSSGLRKPIGSIAEKVLMQLPCPIIITRPASQPAP